MRSPTFLLAVALGALPSLTVASPCGDNVAIKRLPVFSSSDGPFILRAQEGFNVFLKKDSGRDGYIPVISKKEDDLPEFSLKDGNVTTADESLGAYYAAVTLPLPPPLLSVVFGKEVAGKNGAEVIFITRTRSDGSGREVRRLFFLDGPPVVKALKEGEPIFVKPAGNVSPTVQLDIDVRRPDKSGSVDHKACADNQEYFKNWELK